MKFRDELSEALTHITELEPERGDHVSEVALVAQWIGGAETTAQELRYARDLFRTTFELLADAGYVFKAGHMWGFRRTFRRGDVQKVLAWTGKRRSTTSDTSNNEIHAA